MSYATANASRWRQPNNDAFIGAVIEILDALATSYELRYLLDELEFAIGQFRGAVEPIVRSAS